MPIKNNCNCIHGSIGTENEAIQGSIGKRTVRGKVEDTGFATVIKDHSKLDNLDYEHSGHTGFASSQDLEKKENKINFITLGETQGILDKKTLTKLISNLNNKIVYNLGIYHLIARNGENWLYSYTQPSTGASEYVEVNTRSGAYIVSSINPIQDNLNMHIQNTAVHLQNGERANWNQKVTAVVEETTEQLKLF